MRQTPKLTFYLLSVLFLRLFAPLYAAEQVTISEFLASNTSGLRDENNEFSDWIELRNPDAAIPRPFGLRITLKPGDPFRKLLGADWNKTHWYGSATERDAALIEMSRKHEYSRPGDKPALKFDKVEKLHESRGL